MLKGFMGRSSSLVLVEQRPRTSAAATRDSPPSQRTCRAQVREIIGAARKSRVQSISDECSRPTLRASVARLQGCRFAVPSGEGNPWGRLSVSDLRAGATSSVRLLLELGRGGMGVAYLAVAQGPGGFAKLKVVKRLRSDLAADPRAVEMFLAEARLAARLRHPNVVQTNEVGYDGKHYFLEMEYLEGQSLDALQRRAARDAREPPLPLDALDPRADVRRPALRPRAGRLRRHAAAGRAPRRLAAQRLRDLRRAREAPRLRDRQGGRLRQRDPDGRRQGQGSIHGAGASGARQGRSPRRRLRPGGHAVAGADRASGSGASWANWRSS